MNKKLYRILSFCFVVIWMIIIFLLSAMDGNESNDKSKKMINKAIITSAEDSKDPNAEDEAQGINYTQENSGSLENNKESIEAERKEQIVEELNRPLRKCMHASVYLILALLSYNFISSFELGNQYLKYILPLIIVFLYACTDEYHQTFVVGRTGQFSDVLIDTLGGAIGCGLTMIVTIHSQSNIKLWH